MKNLITYLKNNFSNKIRDKAFDYFSRLATLEGTSRWHPKFRWTWLHEQPILVVRNGKPRIWVGCPTWFAPWAPQEYSPRCKSRILGPSAQVDHRKNGVFGSWAPLISMVHTRPDEHRWYAKVAFLLDPLYGKSVPIAFEIQSVGGKSSLSLEASLAWNKI